MKALIISLNDPIYYSARTIQFAKVVDAIKSAGITTYVIVNIRTKQYIDKYNSDQTIYISTKLRSSFKGLGKIKNRVNVKYYKFFPYQNKSLNEYMKKALSIIEINQPDCIITSSNPVESHFVGLLIKEKTNLPWIASFSDPRPNSILPAPYKKTKGIQSYFEKYWIKKVLKISDAIHMPSKYGVDLTKKAFRMTFKDKFYIIPHIGSYSHKKMDNKYKGWLVHAGRIIKSRISTQFLLAIREVHKQIPDYFKGLLCIGIVSSEFKSKVKELNMEKIVKIIGQVSYDESNTIIANATAALLLEANMEMSPFLPSKFVDYVYNKKPVLAVTPPISAIRDYINKFGGGIAVNNNKIEIIKGLITLFLNDDDINNKFEKFLNKLAQEFSYKKVSNMYYKMISEIIL